MAPNKKRQGQEEEHREELAWRGGSGGKENIIIPARRGRGARTVPGSTHTGERSSGSIKSEEKKKQKQIILPLLINHFCRAAE